MYSPLFMTAKTGEQPTCPVTGDWIKNMRYIHTTEYYSSTTKNEIMPFTAIWTDPEFTKLREGIRKTKRNSICCHLYMESQI